MLEVGYSRRNRVICKYNRETMTERWEQRINVRLATSKSAMRLLTEPAFRVQATDAEVILGECK